MRTRICVKTFAALLAFACIAILVPATHAGNVKVHPDRQAAESLDRGLVALPREDDGVYVGWRLLKSDPADIAFHVYRGKKRLTKKPVRKTTDFVDETAQEGQQYEYHVRPVLNGKEGKPSRSATVEKADWKQPHFSIPLQGDYDFQKVGIGDLNGDGRYDFVIKQPDSNIDPWYKYWKPGKGTYKVEAYLHDGTFLWRKDLGSAIERGIWYSPMIVYDLDGDGKAEVALKTGEGEPARSNDLDEDDLPLPVRGDPPVYKGKVLAGPEYVSVLDGMTGDEICRADWPERKPFRSYNKASRNQICVAYLDGKTPHLIVERGTYGPIILDAYEFRGGKLHKLWRWDNRDESGKYRAQGAHSMHAVDIDGDSRDEIFIGSAVVDENGKGLWSTGLGHPDHHYVSDIMPWRDGLEVYYGIEPDCKRNGMCVVDAESGKILWGLDEFSDHVHSSGLCADLLAEHEGMECYAIDRDHPDGEKHRMFSAKGELLSRRDMGFAPRAVFWDADGQRELFRGHRMVDYDGTKQSVRLPGKPHAFADVLGDWREELIVTRDGELRVYTTRVPAKDRRICLMQDPIYRLDVAIQAMGYTQIPMLSYFVEVE